MAHSSAVVAAKERLERLAVTRSAATPPPGTLAAGTVPAAEVADAVETPRVHAPGTPAADALDALEEMRIADAVWAADGSDTPTSPSAQRAATRGRRLRELGTIARADVRAETGNGSGGWGRIRWRVRPVAVGGVALILLAVLGLVGWRTLAIQAHDLPERADELAASATAPAAPGTEGPPAGAAEAVPESDVEPVVVHVAGHVRQPGLVSLPATARIADAIEAAGGASEDADLSRINLARRVTDGEQIFVPDATGDRPGMVDAEGATPAGPSESTAASGNQVDINHAAAGELQTVPGIGPVLADRIIEWRTANGPFATVDDLTSVSGIGPAKLEKMRAHVRVG